VANVVQANLLAAATADPTAVGQIYNVAAGGRLSLNELYGVLRELVAERHPELQIPPPVYENFRAGDVRHSQADISKARLLLGYEPSHDLRSGLREALPWYEARPVAEASRVRMVRNVGGGD
jgi:UDP-N-acetylglucosamine 4-epimerase